MYQNHLEGLIKITFLGPNPKFPNLVGLEWSLTSSQVRHRLVVWAPHLKITAFCKIEIFLFQKHALVGQMVISGKEYKRNQTLWRSQDLVGFKKIYSNYLCVRV